MNRPPTVTVLIATYNRARLLDETLESLSSLRVAPRDVAWDVLIVDKNSSDSTRAIVESRARRFPVPLRYLFEGAQGKSRALNAGLALCDASIIAFTDDDVRVSSGWLEAGVRPLLSTDAIEYTRRLVSVLRKERLL